ncbi:hypothetical protein A4X06_0g3811 [Tilletia controversa]|uniref:Uncharacterized protein n=3 Tax=Tilletia TaxID=13289 RepID=A0A8X7SXT5_9BASI|nr:hypothetical protein A4X06_0g3811 [Tilletia controversa]
MLGWDGLTFSFTPCLLLLLLFIYILLPFESPPNTVDMKLATSTLLFCLALGTAGVSAWDPTADKQCKQYALSCPTSEMPNGYAYCKSKTTWCKGKRAPCRKACMADLGPVYDKGEQLRRQCEILCNGRDDCPTPKPKGCGPL